MAFVVAQRVIALKNGRGRSMLRAGRVLADKLRLRTTLSPQQRANLYVSRTPIAVLSASLSGYPSDGAGK